MPHNRRQPTERQEASDAQKDSAKSVNGDGSHAIVRLANRRHQRRGGKSGTRKSQVARSAPSVGRRYRHRRIGRFATTTQARHRSLQVALWSALRFALWSALRATAHLAAAHLPTHG